MKKKLRITSIFDFLGIAALVGAIGSLATTVALPTLVSEASLFASFHTCLAVGLSALLIGRVVELGRVIATTPNPKRLRAEGTAAAEAQQSEVLAVSNVTQGDFRKAA